MAADDFEQVTVRIYKTDHRMLMQLQVNDVSDGKRKPSFAELVHKGTLLLAKEAAE